MRHSVVSSAGETGARPASFGAGREFRPPLPPPFMFPDRLEPRRAARTALSLLLVATSACAATGSTFKSGVGDAYPAHAPYYAGTAVGADMKLGWLPVTYQRGDALANDVSKSGASTPLGELVADMNRYLDSLGVAPRLAADGPARGTPPDVQFGCISTTAGNDCDARNRPLFGRESGGARLAVGRPSREWIDWAGSAMATAGVPNVLVISVEVSDYYVRQKGMTGAKEVELGTGYTVSLPWLTGLDTPANVLQLTGALMNADGTAVRIGAEGMLAKRTGMVAGAFGAQEIITADDIAQLRTARRTDLAGQPLVWQVALRNLVAGLTGRPELAMR